MTKSVILTAIMTCLFIARYLKIRIDIIRCHLVKAGFKLTDKK